MNENQKLDEILEEIRHLKEGMSLLQDIWGELGAYRDGKVSNETWHIVQDFFKFDDSE